MIDNCNYWNSLSKCIKMKFVLLFIILYSNINMNVVKAILPKHIRENKDFSQQLLSAEANFEGFLMVKDYMTLILLLYCIKR